jgi:hypothetical protein
MPGAMAALVANYRRIGDPILGVSRRHLFVMAGHSLRELLLSDQKPGS